MEPRDRGSGRQPIRWSPAIAGADGNPPDGAPRSRERTATIASQSPDDFEGAEDGHLDNMGMTLAFNTQARPGPTRRIFGSGCSLTGLNVGEALCRIRAEAKTRKIVSWEP